MKVAFFHGLESPVQDGVPVGTKAQFLRREVGAFTPAFDNRAAIDVVRRIAAGERVGEDERLAAFSGPLETALAALDEPVDVAVGSSFGGALLLEALRRRAEAGRNNPGAVLLAGAGPKLFGHAALPPGRFALIHGLADDIVPIGGSRLLARSTEAALLEVDDGHALRSTVGPTLLRAIGWAHGEHPVGHLVAGATIRPERPEDADAVRSIHVAAFEGPAEAKLVDAVRGTPDLVVSLVAERAGRVIGHAAFLRARTATATGVALAPLAVHPDVQRGRLGAALAVAGQDACRALGEPWCAVLGEPGYYARLGWRSASDFGVDSAYGVPEGVFRVLMLDAAAPAPTGRILYPDVLDALGV